MAYVGQGGGRERERERQRERERETEIEKGLPQPLKPLGWFLKRMHRMHSFAALSVRFRAHETSVSNDATLNRKP